MLEIVRNGKDPSLKRKESRDSYTRKFLQPNANNKNASRLGGAQRENTQMTGLSAKILFFHPRNNPLKSPLDILDGGGVTEPQGVAAALAKGIASNGADTGLPQ